MLKGLAESSHGAADGAAASATIALCDSSACGCRDSVIATGSPWCILHVRATGTALCRAPTPLSPAGTARPCDLCPAFSRSQLHTAMSGVRHGLLWTNELQA